MIGRKTWCPFTLVLAVQFLPIHTASAQLLQELEQTFQQMAEAAGGCCVKVEIVQQVPKEELVFEMAGARIQRRTVEKRSYCSGIILDREGFVATLGQPLKNATRVSVRRFDGEGMQGYKADVVGYNLDSNMGLLRIQGPVTFEGLPLGDSDTVRPGSIVMGVGYTSNLDPLPCFSVGLINATNRSFQFRPQGETLKSLFQSSLSIRIGEEGGAVVNTSLEVVGLLLTSYQPPRTSPFMGGLAWEGITLVLPINRVKKEVEWILAKSEEETSPAVAEKSRPWLGLGAGDITDWALRQQLKMPEGGVLVSYIYPNEPAAKAGIMKNDVIFRWNNILIQDFEHLKELLNQSGQGESVVLLVIREGEEHKIDIHIGSY